MPHYAAELSNGVSRYTEVIVLGSKKIHTEYFSEKVKIVKLFDVIQFSVEKLKDTFYPQNLLALLSFRKIGIIDQIRPDLIHLTTPLIPPLPLFILLYRLGKKYPIIYTVHSTHQDSGFFMEMISRINTFFAESINFKRIIVHTERDKEELVKKGSFSKKKILVIPHGVYDIFKRFSDINASEISTVKERYILFFGYIKQYKGLEILLRSAPRIFTNVKNIKLIIAGQGDLTPYRETIDRFIGQEYRSNLEIYNEFIPDKQASELFRKASIVVLPYTQMTGQSGIVNIAFAFGKPVVATDIWGFHEAIASGKTGILVPPNDSWALANAVIKILTNMELQTEMGKNILNESQKLSWEILAKRYIEVYEEVLSEERG